MNIHRLFSASLATFFIGVGSVFAQAPVTYTSSEDFEAALVAGSYTEDFTRLRTEGPSPGWGESGGSMSTGSYAFPQPNDGNFGFTAQTASGNLSFLRNDDPGANEWEGDGLGTQSDRVTWSIIPDAPVSGLGGYFFIVTGGIGGGQFVANQALNLVFSFETGPNQTFLHSSATHEDSFFGITNEDDLITGLSLQVVSPEGSLLAASSDVTMGTVPEPSTVALLMSVFVLGFVVIRRRIVRTVR